MSLSLRRIFGLLCVILVVGLPQVGLASQQVVSNEEVWFRADGLPRPNATRVDALAAREALRVFLLKYPNYRIEPFSMPAVEGSSMDSGPLMAIAAGVPAHAMYVNFRQSSTYINHGFLEPQEILLARVLSDNPRVRETDDNDNWLEDPTEEEVKAALEAIRERVPGPAWPVVYRAADDEGVMPGEHVWAMPTGTLIMAMLYRKDLYYAAGLDPEKPAETWDELLEHVRKLTIPEKRQYGLRVSGGQVISWGIYTFLVSNGGRAMEKIDGEWMPTFATRNTAEAIYYFWQMARGEFERDGQTIQGAVNINAPSLEWDRGKIGIQFSYLEEELLASLNPQLVGIAPVPLSWNGTRGSEINCRMLGIFAESTPQQKLAIMRYIWFLTGEEAQRIRTRIFVDNGYGKFVNPDLLEKFGYDRLLRQVPPGWTEAFDVALENGVPEPYGKNTQFIYRDMSEPINAALEMPLGNMPKDEAISQIERMLEAKSEQVSRDLGNLSPKQMMIRRTAAIAVILLVGGAFCFGMYRVWTYFSLVAKPFAEQAGWRKFIWGYILLSPAMIILAFWAYLPLAGGLSLAFMDYELIIPSTWIGVDNFADALFDRRFWSALGRTVYFVALTIGLGFWPPILLAILLDEVPTDTLKYIFRTVFYLPAIISGVVVMFLWRQLYDSSPYGVLNQLLLSLNTLHPVVATLVKLLGIGLWASLIAILFWLPIKMKEMTWPVRSALWIVGAAFLMVTVWPVITAYQGPGMLEIKALNLNPNEVGGIGAAISVIGNLVGQFNLEPLKWVDSPELAMICVVVPTVWMAAGPGCILYLAALKTVPSELYEAADIDGAGTWQKICYITLPRLKYLIVIQFIAAVIGAFKGGTDYILALTGGGPNGATTILALEIFNKTFLDLRFGLGAAMAWMLGALLIAFTAYQLKMLSNAEFRAAGGTEK